MPKLYMFSQSFFFRALDMYQQVVDKDTGHHDKNRNHKDQRHHIHKLLLPPLLLLFRLLLQLSLHYCQHYRQAHLDNQPHNWQQMKAFIIQCISIHDNNNMVCSLLNSHRIIMYHPFKWQPHPSQIYKYFLYLNALQFYIYRLKKKSYQNS